MPINKIQVSEYECIHCKYKWVNRVNGKDGPIPKKCAKCKRMNWNGITEGNGYDPITPDERSLRTQLYKYEGQHYLFMGIPGREYGPNELCKAFLNLNPRPNIIELLTALHPIGTYPKNYDSYKHRYNHYIPDPDPKRPHYPDKINLKRGDRTLIPHPKRKGFYTWKRVPLLKSQYVKTLIQETILRRKYMKEIIGSRGQTVSNIKEKKLPLPAWFITMWGDSFQYHPDFSHFIAETAINTKT